MHDPEWALDLGNQDRHPSSASGKRMSFRNTILQLEAAKVENRFLIILQTSDTEMSLNKRNHRNV